MNLNTVCADYVEMVEADVQKHWLLVKLNS